VLAGRGELTTLGSGWVTWVGSGLVTWVDKKRRIGYALEFLRRRRLRLQDFLNMFWKFDLNFGFINI